eukprot:TRINITY_DN5748_c0_g1_i1.p1 TRINITY_DN5748_c0_g1~~TRINITY_DN5748_c0_g1_i1.p1  ORF type:complete len:819 (+),score=178.07 TRINITY_DN5748_c0_g1_i1:132-2459(+)
MGAAASCYRRLVDRIVLDTDTPADILRKDLWTFFSAVSGVLAAVAFAVNSARVDGFWFGCLGSWVIMHGGLIYVWCTKTTPRWLLDRSCFALAICMLLTDLANAPVPGQTRTWPQVILVVDAMLVLDGSHRMTTAIVHMTAAYLVVTSIEDAFRLGLYDIAYLTEPDADYLRDRTECSSPPCPSGLQTGVLSAFVYLLVLYIDFGATRRFATGMKEEQQLMTAAVDIAELVATCLARFDLDTARGALARTKGSLPAELDESFTQLLGNLASYKPYLPQSVLQKGFATDEEWDDVEDSRDAPLGVAASMKSSPMYTQSCLEDAMPGVGAPGSPTAGGQPGIHLFAPFSGEDTCQPADHDRRGPARPQRPSRLSDSANSGRRSMQVGGPRDRRQSRLSNCGGAPAVAAVGSPVLYKRVTLLVCNRRGFLGRTQMGPPPAVVQWMAAEVAHFVDVVNEQRGIVDLLSADHLFANFGAARPCTANRAAAARCGDALCVRADTKQIVASPASPALNSTGASSSQHPSPLAFLGQGGQSPVLTDLGPVQTSDYDGLSDGQSTAAHAASVVAVNGRLLCGDFGSATSQRFMALGGTSSLLLAAERLAAQWGTRLLVDHSVYSDAQTTFDCRRRQRVVFPKRGSPDPISFWELTAQRMGGGGDEWMYELERAGRDRWEVHNQCADMWIKGMSKDALQSVNDDLQDTNKPPELLAALEHLRCLIASGSDPDVLLQEAGAQAPQQGAHGASWQLHSVLRSGADHLPDTLPPRHRGAPPSPPLLVS